MKIAHQLLHNQDAIMLIHMLGSIVHVYLSQNILTTHPMFLVQNMEVDVIRLPPQTELELIVKIEIQFHLVL